MKHLLSGIGLIICLILTNAVFAQVAVPFKSATGDTIRTVYIWHADTLKEAKKDTLSKVQSLFGHVKLQQDKTLFFCDSVAMDQSTNTAEAFGNVHIDDADSTNIYSQYMKYFVDKKLVIFKKKVTLVDANGTLTTEELQYDLNQKIGIYSNGGKIVSKTTVVTSKEGTYYGDTKDIYFRKNVVLKDPQYDLTADSLLYNTNSKIATFVTLTHIRDSSGRTIVTRDGYYNLKDHKAQFGKRPKITSGSQSIIGNKVEFDDSTGMSVATGNAIFKDTAQEISVIANLLQSNNKANTVLATEHPLAIFKQEKDSIYVTADTLYSAPFSDSGSRSPNALSDSLQMTTGSPTASNDSSHRYLQAYHHVKIFSDSLQAISDSMFYSGRDSVFQLFTNPIVWAGGYQITGDTIYLYTKNKKPEHLYVFENALVVSKSGDNMYNQIKGNTLNIYFKDGEIDYMRVRGNAESIFYIKDDSLSLVGVNRVNRSDIIDMIFREKELNKVVLRNDADGIMIPIRQINADELRLRSFRWLDDKRPKTRFELFEN